MTSSPPEQGPRRLRSFVRRQGRLTEGQNRALETLWPDFGLHLDQGMLDYTQVFGNPNPVILLLPI